MFQELNLSFPQYFLKVCYTKLRLPSSCLPLQRFDRFLGHSQRQICKTKNHSKCFVLVDLIMNEAWDSAQTIKTAGTPVLTQISSSRATGSISLTPLLFVVARMHEGRSANEPFGLYHKVSNINGDARDRQR